MRMDRAFLVPYLENVFVMELALNYVRDEKSACCRRAAEVESQVRKVKQPQNEPRQQTWYGIGAFFGYTLTIGGAVMCLGALIGAVDSASMGIWVFSFLLGLAWLLPAIRDKRRTEEANQAIDARNEAKHAEFEKSYRQLVINAKTIISTCNAQAVIWGEKEKEVEAALRQVYSVNIIPSKYRDIYAAAYLYDWFSTGRSDDLDMALNTFVLEQVKDRLDTIIRNQCAMILNQRIMIANQRQAMDQAEHHNAMLMDKLDQFEASNEERNMYLSMIEVNTAVDAFFAAAEYLRK